MMAIVAVAPEAVVLAAGVVVACVVFARRSVAVSVAPVVVVAVAVGVVGGIGVAAAAAVTASVLVAVVEVGVDLFAAVAVFRKLLPRQQRMAPWSWLCVVANQAR